ncbi:MAG: hypothetical protein AB8B81_07660 [Halioglobus sp.]
MNFLNDLLDRLPFSKGFLVVVAVIVLFFLSIEDPQVKHDQAIAEFENSIEIRKQKVTESIATLPIADTGLLNCVTNAAADRASIPPTSSGGIDDVRELELLYCPGSKIKSLDGIGELSALRFVDLSKNNIKSLAALTNLKQLKNIRLADNPLGSVRALKSMPALKEVSLPNMPDVACTDIRAAVKSLKSNYKTIKCYGQRENRVVTLNSGSSVSKKKSKKSSGSSTELTASEQRELFEYEREQRYRNK